MAREAAVFGVPAVYTGGRTMCVNTPFINLGGVVSVTVPNRFSLDESLAL